MQVAFTSVHSWDIINLQISMSVPSIIKLFRATPSIDVQTSGLAVTTLRYQLKNSKPVPYGKNQLVKIAKSLLTLVLMLLGN